MNAIPNYENAKELYLFGYSLKQVSKTLGINPKKLSFALKQDNVKIRHSKYQYNETFFNDIDTEEKAYWLGFIYADGYVNNMGKYVLELTLASKDKDHVIRIKNLLCPEKPVTEFNSQLNSKTYSMTRLNITCKHIVNSLVAKECKPAKSLTVQFPDVNIVPSCLMRHFIRGYFDGNGSVYISNNCITFAIISGSYNFLRDIQSHFSRELDGYTPTKIIKNRKDRIVYKYLKCGKNVVKQIYEYLYNDASIYLPRKYEKFLEVYDERIAKDIN